MNKITESLNRQYITEAVFKMSDNDIKKKLIEIIKEQLKISRVDMNKTLTEQGMDSLDAVEIVMEIEEEFGVKIPDDTWEKMSNPLSKVRNETTVKEFIKITIEFIRGYHKTKPSSIKVKGVVRKLIKKLAK